MNKILSFILTFLAFCPLTSNCFIDKLGKGKGLQPNFFEKIGFLLVGSFLWKLAKIAILIAILIVVIIVAIKVYKKYMKK
jgi:hypothetical protein